MNKLYVSLIAGILLFTSCFKDTVDDLSNLKGIQTSATWSLPLFKIEQGLDAFVRDLDSNVTIRKDPNRMFVMGFKSKDSLPPTQLFIVPQVQPNIAPISLPPLAIAQFENTGTFGIDLENNEDLGLTGGKTLDRIDVKEGKITYNITSSFKHNATIIITYPGITKNGNVLVDSFEFLYTGRNVNITRDVNLAGYLIDFTLNGTTHSKLAYKTQFRLNEIEGNSTSTSDAIQFSEKIVIDKYNTVEGYFGELILLQLGKDNTINFFDKKLEGGIYFSDPRVKFTVENSIGIPITGKVTELFVNTGSGQRIDIEIDQFKDTFNLNYTTLPNQAAITEYTINNTNSNIDEIVSSAPQSISYRVKFTANSDGVAKPNILYDNSTLKVNSIFELPFDFIITNFQIEPAGPFALGNDLKKLEDDGLELNFAEAFTHASSDLPLGATIQVYFTDSNKTENNIVDSLFPQALVLPSAQVDANGDVIGKASNYYNTFVSKEKLERLQYANTYKINIKLNTSTHNGNSPSVRFYDDQRIKVTLALKSKATYKTKIK